MKRVPLKALAEINLRKLPEDTDAERVFGYIDIESVGRGKLVAEPEEMSFGVAPSRARRLVSRGDTIISTVRTYLRSTWFVDRPGDDLVVSTGFAVLSPHQDVHPPYLGWAIQSDEVIDQVVARSVGVSYPAVNPSELGRISVPLPDGTQQRVIADYLDRETARIDAVIEKKQRILSLRESRAVLLGAATILGTVAGPGYRPVVVPGSWRVVPFGRLFKEVDDRSADGTEELLSVSQTRGVIPQSALGDRHQHAETLVGYKRCRAGDIVVNRMWVYYGALGVAPGSGIVSPDYAVFRAIGGLRADLAALILRTPPFVGEMTRLVRGVGVAFQGTVRKPRLHPKDLGKIAMPVPPADVQDSLIRDLEAELRRDSQFKARLARSVELLQEKRGALINAAVTGQLPVPHAA